MKRTQLFNLFVLSGALLLAAGLGAGFLLAAALPPATPGAWALAAAVLAAVLVLGWLLLRFARGYLRQVQELAETGRTLLAANPTLRAAPGTPLDTDPDILALAGIFNALAARFAALQGERAEAIRQGRVEMEEERNLLAALLSELSEGVLACNLEGQILLYNRNACTLLGAADDTATGAFVGLGRSIFSMLDRETVAHAIAQAEARRARLEGSEKAGAERTVVVSFVAAAANGLLLRAALTPFAGAGGSERGYVLILQDLSEDIERSIRRDRLLQTLTERTRSSVAAIRAASETIEHFPHMTEEQRRRLQTVILDEAQALSEHLGETLRTHAGDLRAQWQLEEIHGADLLWSLQRHLQDACSLPAHIHTLDETLWLKIDSYTLLQGLGQALGGLAVLGVTGIELRLQAAGGFAALEAAWTQPQAGAAAGEAAAWDAWQRQALLVDDADGVLSLREVADRHGGEVWVERQVDPPGAALRLLLPQTAEPPRPGAVTPSAVANHPAAPVPSRPAYYDFDLFARREVTPQEDRPLSELVCTVFDTETTGLQPDYDEIIAIGALRIVNGRMLRGEIFEQLIDPRRPVPAASIAFHGITDAMLAGQPPVERVLPLFHQFAAGAVLVGHNLAFDLRMFAAKERVTGVRFDGPVLDTLLLSAVVHPQAESHSLEAIAGRLGLPVLGRHTALGDALLTGEIFLHLLPLLAEQGITTLRQAQAAAQQTYLARLRY